MSAYDTQYTSDPICPHCGHKYRDAWELPIDDMEGEAEVECGGCEKPYVVSRTVAVSYSTSMVKPKPRLPLASGDGPDFVLCRICP